MRGANALGQAAPTPEVSSQMQRGQRSLARDAGITNGHPTGPKTVCEAPIKNSSVLPLSLAYGFAMIQRMKPSSPQSNLPTGQIAILRLPEVQRRTGLSRSTIYAYVSRGKFPVAVPVGERAVGWVEDEVCGWIQRRIAIRQRP